jgi:hypothetical protein
MCDPVSMGPFTSIRVQTLCIILQYVSWLCGYHQVKYLYTQVPTYRFCSLGARVPGYRTEMKFCFLCGTNWIYICYVEESRPPLWSGGQSSRLQERYVLCFLWGTNWICMSYAEESRPPLWSSGQSSWLQKGDVLCFLWGTNWIYVCYNSMVWVRERTIPTERPPLVGEVIANFFG